MQAWTTLERLSRHHFARFFYNFTKFFKAFLKTYVFSGLTNANAFTLAEVLITLGIIGIVAAMTLPALITDAKKQATVTSVKKFYNIINNTIQFSIAENGDVSNWMGEAKNATYKENLKFAQQYLLKYQKYIKYENCHKTAVCIYLADGGMYTFSYDGNGGDVIYFVNGKLENNRRNAFAFQFNKDNGTDEDGNTIERENRKTIVEPYVFQWNGEYEQLINHPQRGCRKTNSNTTYGTYCTKLLQMNDWKITKDFPW